MRTRILSIVAALAAGLLLSSPASAQVTLVTNLCGGPNSVRVVTFPINTYEYFFQSLTGGPVYQFSGIPIPTSISHTRDFNLPVGRYRLTFRIPNTTPIGTYGPDVVVKPYRIVNGICLFTGEARKR